MRCGRSLRADPRVRQLILIPGLMNDADVWRDVAAPLSSAARVRVADISRGETLAGLADEVVEGVEGAFALVGFSLGGIVALEVFRRARGRVSHLGLIGTTAFPDSAERAVARQRVLAQLGTGERFHGFGAMLAKEYLAPESAADPALVGRIKAMAERLGPDVLARQTLLGRPDNSALLPTIDCSTAVACGALEQVTPPAVHQRLAGAIAGATLEVVPGSGHVLPMERPDAVVRIVSELLARLGR